MNAHFRVRETLNKCGSRDPNAHELSMRLASGDVVYDFPLLFKLLDPRGHRATLKG